MSNTSHKGAPKKVKGKNTSGVEHRTLPMNTRNALLDDLKINPTNAEVQQSIDERNFMTQPMLPKNDGFGTMTSYVIRVVKGHKPAIIHTRHIARVTALNRDKVIAATKKENDRIISELDKALREIMFELSIEDIEYTSIIRDSSCDEHITAEDLIGL